MQMILDVRVVTQVQSLWSVFYNVKVCLKVHQLFIVCFFFKNSPKIFSLANLASFIS